MFELAHSDIWAPTIESFDGFKYFITFIDDFCGVPKIMTGLIVMI